jgi:hypothetical protein
MESQNNYCSPKTHHENKNTLPLNKTCLDVEGMKRYVRLYNKQNLDKIVVPDNANANTLYNIIQKKMRRQCKNKGDWCWVDQSFAINDKHIQSYYKPPVPENQHKWLDTKNITYVMTQYQERYPDFLFLGAVPIDFDDLKSLGISSLQFCQKHNKQNKNRVGIVFNLDKHYERGSHWVSMFFDLTRGYIAFFDSVGNEPTKEIRVFMNRLQKQVENCFSEKLQKHIVEFKKYSQIINKTQHQKKNTECGVYSLYFIVKCLEGEHPRDIFNNRNLNDDVMHTFRSVFFRPSMNADNSMFKQKYSV